jgi:hypothetical protein
MKSSEAGPVKFPPREFEGIVPGYLPCTVAYCRWFWELVEPEDGKYDWSVVEQALEVAGERGQTLQVRLMPHGGKLLSPDQPPVPRWYVERYPTHDVVQKRRPATVPFYDGPEYLDKWGALIAEFGLRFGGHPQLESVDISFIGPWGEGAGECSEEAIDRMTQIYVDAHPKTPLMAMISGYKMTAGVKHGTGWRLDCFGDIGIYRDEDVPREQWFMHHYDCYPKEVCVCGAQDAWKNGPVTFETCSVPMKWFGMAFDLDFIRRQGLKFHGSVFMPKSTELPEEWMDNLLQFCNDIGYRFVLRQFSFDSPVEDRRLICQCWIENVGVAPIYHPYTFAVRLRQGSCEHVHHSAEDIRKWLPGDVWLVEQIDVPKTFQPGIAMLHAALVDPRANEAKVRFAVEGADEDGWVPLDTVEIV